MTVEKQNDLAEAIFSVSGRCKEDPSVLDQFIDKFGLRVPHEWVVMEEGQADKSDMTK
jgi:hypothetical protein